MTNDLERKFFITSAFLWGTILLFSVGYAQNASTVSLQSNVANKTKILQQSEISEIIQKTAKRPQFAEQDQKGPIKLSASELEKSRQIDALVRKSQKRDERQSDVSKKIQDLVVKLQPETNEILKQLNQERKAAIIEARNQNLREQQQELERLNAENRRKMNKYFNDVLKNLPQKGRHKNYSAYNKRFKPIVRK